MQNIKQYWINLSKRNKFLLVGLILVIIGAVVITATFIVLNNRSRNNNSNSNLDEDTLSYPVISYPESSETISYPDEIINIPKSVTYTVSSSGYDSSTKTITQTVEGDQKLIALFIIDNLNLDGTECIAKTFKYTNSGLPSPTETRNFTLNPMTHITYQFGEGSYAVEFNCNYDGVDHIETFKANVNWFPGSVCDAETFDNNFSFKNVDESKSAIIGSWKGCTKNPFGGPYRVDFIFRENSYISSNLEKDENGGTRRTSPAAYYPYDYLSQMYSLNDDTADGVKGTMWRNDYPANQTLIKISNDGNTMYMEFRYKNEDPIYFLLKKVV